MLLKSQMLFHVSQGLQTSLRRRPRGVLIAKFRPFSWHINVMEMR